MYIEQPQLRICALLVNPDRNISSYIPLGLISLMGYSQEFGFDVEIFDFQGKTEDEFVTKLLERPWRLVGFTGLISHYKDLKSMTGQVKHYCTNALIIIGGPLANILPELLIKELNIDLAITGEGEVPFLTILNMLSSNSFDLEKIPGAVYKSNHGKIVKNSTSPVLVMDNIPLLPNHGFDIGAYKSHPLGQTVNIQLSRGCPNSCSYCDNSLFPKHIRRRSKQNIVEELARVSNQYSFDFIYLDDLNPFVSRGLIEDFCETIKSLALSVKWYGNGRAEVIEKLDLDILVEGNCGGLHFGIESGSEKILSEFNKHISLSKSKRAIRAVMERGIEVKSHWIIGAPSETMDTVRESIEYFVSVGTVPAIRYLTPLPGTQFFDVAVQKGRVKNLDDYLMSYSNWYDDRPICNISNFSDEALIEIARAAETEIKARVGFSSKWSGIWKPNHPKSVYVQ